MKILQVFDLFSPYGGGTVDLLYKLSKALAQKGHEVVIYTSDFKLDQEYIQSLLEVKVYPFRCLSSLAEFYFMPSMIKGVKEQLRDFDIVHLHCLRSFQNIVVHYYALKYNNPYVLDAHGSTPRMAGGKRGSKWLLRWLFDVAFGYRILRDAGKVIAETEVGVKEYKELGIDKDKIALIPPPFDTEEFCKLPPLGVFRSKYDIGDRKIVMFLGRIHWIRGPGFLVESFDELAKWRNDVTLVIVGNDDGYKSTLEKLIDKLNLSDKVLFTGFLGGAEKISALVDADVIVQTSRYEQGAWAPFEAVLCGTPIIVTKHTGAGEDVKRLDAGYLVEFSNKKELAELILRILKDPVEAIAKAGQAAEYIRENMSITKRIEDYEKLYIECMEENIN